MKKSIARKMSMRVSASLAAAFVLLLTGSFITLDREIVKKSEQYAKMMVGVFGDLIVYEANNHNEPIDTSFSDRIAFFADYLCDWYRVDCLYAYTPDFDNGKLTYLAVKRDKAKFGALSEDLMAGVTEDCTFSDAEIAAWDDSSRLVVQKSERFIKSWDVKMMIQDNLGNKAMVGVSYSLDTLRKEVIYGIHVAGLFVLITVLLLAAFLYLQIRRMVSRPATHISQKMNEYVSGGERSSIKLEEMEDDEFGMIARAFNHMTGEMDDYIKDIARLGREHERQQAEVDIASEIQKGLLSSGTALLGNCLLNAGMKPAKYIGGDLYDYLEIDRSHTMMVVADVSGKGISSAMLMAIVLTLIRQFARMGYSPAEILKNVNTTLSEENPRMMFVTVFIGIYDSGKEVLTYANAGHNPPYIIRNEPEVLDGSHGTPIGLFKEEEYNDIEVTMKTGDTIFLYTDGVNEAVNESGEFYGVDRLERVLGDTVHTEDKNFVEAVEESLRDFVGNAEQNDDITMLTLHAMDNPVLELDYDIREFSEIKSLMFSSLLPRQLMMDLCLAAEECFVNICSYAFDGPVPEGEKIRFSFEYSDNVVMRFSDGGKRFDPRNNLPDTVEYDIDTQIGGLGRLLAFSVADSVDYEYIDGRNILTIKKSIKNY